MPNGTNAVSTDDAVIFVSTTVSSAMGALGCSDTVTFVGVASSGDTTSLEVDSVAVTAAVVSSCKDTIGIASSIGGDSIITIDE